MGDEMAFEKALAAWNGLCPPRRQVPGLQLGLEPWPGLAMIGVIPSANDSANGGPSSERRRCMYAPPRGTQRKPLSELVRYL